MKQSDRCHIQENVKENILMNIEHWTCTFIYLSMYIYIYILWLEREKERVQYSFLKTILWDIYQSALQLPFHLAK